MTSSSGKTIRLRASAAAVRYGKILLVPHYDVDSGAHWYLPGGGVEWLEPLEKAAIREFKEETGLEIKLIGLLEVVEDVKPTEPWHSVSVVFSATVLGGALQAENNSYAVYGDKTPRWFLWKELPDVVDYLLPTIQKALHIF